MGHSVNSEVILVVDDGQDNRDFVVDYVLKPNNFQYLLARDGLEGLQMAIQSGPDLILLDWNMPRMNGVEVLEEMEKRGLDIPVILMTFHGSEELAIEVYRLGVRDYVRKPFDPDEMLAAIDRALTETRLRREKDALTNRLIHANRELQGRVTELNVLYSIGKSVTSTADMEALLPKLVEAAMQLTRAEECFLMLVEGDDLVCRAMRRHNSPHAVTVQQTVKDPVALRALKTGLPAVMTPDKVTTRSQGMPWSAAFAPMVIHERIIGVLGVRNMSFNAPVFTNHETALLSALTDYAAIAIQNVRHYDALIASSTREKAIIRDTFERFVPPSIVDRALAHPDSVRLGGKRREVSVVFADIRGYSAWSENAQPEEVVDTLNHYHSLAAEVILAWEGTLDKFMGDGFMAIFNAPDDQPDHVHRAADAALALMKAAGEVQMQHGHRLTYSVGVNVGDAVVGYIGTERAVNFTAVGDTVNLAKRLEEYAAPGQILVEESVIRRLGSLAQTRPLGEVKVKGRQRAALAYELLSLNPNR
jgi:class 3 adenylate cyclase/DNA-binding response OmpR family regulator